MQISVGGGGLDKNTSKRIFMYYFKSRGEGWFEMCEDFYEFVSTKIIPQPTVLHRLTEKKYIYIVVFVVLVGEYVRNFSQ